MTLRFEKTCDACPEQYDVFDGDKMVAYLRLRHGHFTVQCPDVGGECVYEAFPEGDGEFETRERYEYLTMAETAIIRWMKEQETKHD